MDIITVDFETFWDVGHSLSCMSPAAYVMHPRTEIISCAVKVNDTPTTVAFGEAAVRDQLEYFRETIEAGLLLGHNLSGFDAMILAWRFNVRPRLWACTLAMARPLHALDVGLSLGSLVQHHAIGQKDNAVLLATKGKRLVDFTPGEVRSMRKYNAADTDQCRALFDVLRGLTSAREMWLIDSTIRMLVDPQFVLDTPLLQRTLQAERQKKHESLMSVAAALGLPLGGDEQETATAVRQALLSAKKFSALLARLGVATPMKPSPSAPDSGKMVEALAKTDTGFLALREHDNPLVAAAASARLEAKSTLLETRIESLLQAAGFLGGKLPAPIRYFGAHTGRDSGEQYNLQNLPRVQRGKDGEPTDKLTNALRMSLAAPPGHKVIVADLSGIELRVNHFLWNVSSSMALFRASPDKADLYKDFAARMYDTPLEGVSKDQRQVGKVAHLGLGFGAGANTFQAVALTMGGVQLTQQQSLGVVQAWRNTYGEIVQGWQTCQAALNFIRAGQRTPIDSWGLLHTSAAGISLPSGRTIRYPHLRQQVVEEGSRLGRTEWVYGKGRHIKRIYGGRICENVVQALAADVLMDNSIKFFAATKLRPALRVHDELVYIVPEGRAEDLLAQLQTIMRTPPKWWPELITWSEGDVAQSYGEAK